MEQCVVYIHGLLHTSTFYITDHRSYLYNVLAETQFNYIHHYSTFTNVQQQVTTAALLMM